MAFADLPIVFMTIRLWRFSKGNHPWVVFYIALFFFANVVNFLEPLLVALVINTVQEEGITQANLWYLLGLSALFVGRTLLFWVFHWPARIIEQRNAFLVRANFKKFLVEGTLALPAEWHASHHSGDTIDRINKATDALFDYSNSMFLVVEPIVKFSTSYLALVYFNVHASYIVAICSVLAVMAVLHVDVTLRRQWRQLNRYENRISEKIFDVISNVTTVIILRVEAVLAKDITQRIMKPFRLFVANARVNETKWFLVSVCATMMMFLVFSTYIYSSLHAGAIVLAGTLFALYRYVNEINEIFFNMAWRYSDIVRQKTKVENGEALSRQFIPPKAQGSAALVGLWKQVQVRDLTFSYKGTKSEGELHLNKASLDFSRGEHIALIGESGSGKTTFMKLLRALYEPKHVEVFIDGERISGGLHEIGEAITLLPQEPELFTTTIQNNITFGVAYPDRVIRRFTDMACFTKVISRLPKGLESNIMEKGVNLSGGEKQRLALARGLLASSSKPIVLLDEPTSSVDSKTEMEIYDHIFSAFRGKTIISSIHRLHMLHRFDYIYMFKEGRIVGSGSLDHLKKHCSEFRMLWRKYHLKKGKKTVIKKAAMKHGGGAGGWRRDKPLHAPHGRVRLKLWK